MKRYLGLLLACGLAACSGGGGGQAVPRPVRSPAATTGAAIRILVPKASGTSAHARRPAYVSPSTQSLVIDVTSQSSQTALTGFPQTVNLSPTSPGCTATPNGTQCTVSIDAPVGSYDAALSTFDGLNATGNLLSAAQSIPFNILVNQTTTIPLVLSGRVTSMTLAAAGGGLTAKHLSVYALPASASGTFAAFGLDPDGNMIVGPGAPAITATTDDATRITVTQPAPTAPNSIGVTSAGANSIAHVTITVTPDPAIGGNPFSETVTVQTPNLNLLFLATSNGVHVFDATGKEITIPGTFGSFATGVGWVGVAYDSSNGLFYAANQAGSASYIAAFDENGNQQTLSSGATNLATIGGLVYDPIDDLIFAAGENQAFDGSGNPHALNSQIAFWYSLAYNSVAHVIVSQHQVYDTPSANTTGSLPFTGNFGGVTYNQVNGLYYVATFMPTAVTAYNTAGAPQSLSGTFINGSSEEIGSITADPVSGNIYVATNARNTYGFDLNGNPLPLPWHDIAGLGAAAGGAGLVVAPP